MDEKNNGGSAFPDFKQTGITARDYFAAQAMISSMSVMSWRELGYAPENGLSEMQQSARLCYQMADAMIEERAK